MMIIGLGEIFVVLVIRPLRFLVGSDKTPFGRALHRFENWILHHLHVMGAESRMRYELELQGQSSSFLAESLSDPAGSSALPSTSDTIERTRRETGAEHHQALQGADQLGDRELSRGQRQVESRGGGDRSEDVHEAMLQAQRKQNQQAERQRRHNLRRRG